MNLRRLFFWFFENFCGGILRCRCDAPQLTRETIVFYKRRRCYAPYKYTILNRKGASHRPRL
jgi:hypothetical protein